MIKPIKKLLQKELKEHLSKSELSQLSSSYQKIGDILILNLKKELWKHDEIIGEILLKKISNTRTVCRRTGSITSEFRKPQLNVIAGDENTETIHKEHRIVYKLDVKKIMFAKGNLNERKRISKLIRKEEIVVDMFSGVGYWSIPIAKSPKSKKVYAIEINSVAFHYLNENIKLNHVKEKIVPILGDCVVEVSKLGRIADRVIMGLIPSSEEYLLDAMKVVKSDGTIHYHCLAEKDSIKKRFEEVETAAEIAGFKTKLLKCKKVKSYAPKIYHYVLDCQVSMKD